MSSFIDWCFLHASLYRPGAISLGDLPSNQADSQNSTLQLLPTETTMLAQNSYLSSSEQGTSEPTQGLSGSVQQNQSQRSLKARLNSSRSSMSSPPSFFGLFTLSQRTRRWPPLACSAPFQRKPLLILSNHLTIHFFSAKAVRKYVGIDDKTLFSNFSLSTLLRNLPFHDGNLA
jgi:hypothetical protein